MADSNQSNGPREELRDHDLVESFRFDCEVRNLTPKTIECYTERLAYLTDYCQVKRCSLTDLKRKQVQEYILSLRGEVSDETINGRIRAFLRFYNYLIEEGLHPGKNPLQGIRLLKVAKRMKPVIGPETIQRIARSLNRKRFEGMRNLVLILLFWDGMLRSTEARLMTIDNVDLKARLIKVFGKGRKERIIPIGLNTTRIMQQYASLWRVKYPGDYFLCMRDGKPITKRHCHKIIQRLGRKVNVKLHPHLLRHSAATWYIRQGGSPAVLQGILGHSSLLTTQ
jgi:site-specific recombinase XerD